MNPSRRPRQPAIPLAPEAIEVMKTVAGTYADGYVTEFLGEHLAKAMGAPSTLPQDIRDAFMDPYKSLAAFYGHYAFARRGKDRDVFSKLSLEALEEMRGEKSFEEILQREDGSELWELFDAKCKAIGRKSNEPQNRGLLQGVLELAQEIYRLDKVGSIGLWIVKGVQKAGQLEPQFLRIVDIRGVGPKSTSTYMRDLIFYFGVEDKVEPVHRLYLQPIDRWMRAMARHIVPEPGMEKAADWVIAGKVAKYTRRAGVSAIRFNMGATFFGQRRVRDPSRFTETLARLVLEIKGADLDDEEFDDEERELVSGDEAAEPTAESDPKPTEDPQE